MTRWVKFTPTRGDERHFEDWIDADRIVRAAVISTAAVEDGVAVTKRHTALYFDTNRILAVQEGPDHFGIVVRG